MLISNLAVAQPTKVNILKLYDSFGRDTNFDRSDVMKVTGLKTTSAADLLRKLGDLKLIESVPNAGRGKYRFVR